MVPGIDDRPAGCLFNPRCKFAFSRCLTERPELGLANARCHTPLDAQGHPCMTPLMQARNLTRHYPVSSGLFGRHGLVKAVDGVSFDLHAGKTLAVVGESGCGKSTLARLATLMEPPTSGALLIDDAATDTDAARRSHRLSVQMVFQNPYGSLNPRKTVGSILQEPLAINRRGNAAARESAARAMMEKVGLRQDQYGRYPTCSPAANASASPSPAR